MNIFRLYRLCTFIALCSWSADVNGNGAANVLDLVQVANSLGKSAPDPNGDGQVNILDLVFVAQQFSQ